MTISPNAGRRGRPWLRLRQQVADRDNWICQLCGRPIGRNVKYPDPWSLAIDHIVPISRGGDRTAMSNLRASHNLCNNSRGVGDATTQVNVLARPRPPANQRATTVRSWSRCWTHGEPCSHRDSRAHDLIETDIQVH